MAKKSSLIVSKSNINAVTNRLESHFKLSLRYPDALILCRIGSHYALIGKDAQASMRDLDISPVNFGIIPMQSEGTFGPNSNIKVISFKADELDIYLPKLVRAGHRVVIG